MAKGNLGVDWAVYQGNGGVFPSVAIQFGIAQIGGWSGGLYDQSTYTSQINTLLNKGLHAHTYIWYEVGSSTAVAKQVLDYFLPKISAPKDSIIALDYEAGASGDVAGNTQAIIYGMDRIRDAGYTPMYYSYKPYTEQYVDYQAILRKYPNSLWIASYPSDFMDGPNYDYFPSMDGIAIWQFTDGFTIKGGLDGNVDMTGITSNGYGGNVNNSNNTGSNGAKQGKGDDDMNFIKVTNDGKMGNGVVKAGAVFVIKSNGVIDYVKSTGNVQKWVNLLTWEDTIKPLTWTEFTQMIDSLNLTWGRRFPGT